MRFLIVCAMVLTLSLIFGGEAHARRSGGLSGTSQQLSFVASTQIANDTGQQLSLCHLTETTHILSTGIWRRSEGDALAINRCDAETFCIVPAE